MLLGVLFPCMIYRGQNNEYLSIEWVDEARQPAGLPIGMESPLTFIWSTVDDNQIAVDHKLYHIGKHEIVALTEFNQVDLSQLRNVRVITFNKQFYCIINHDSEVSCKGVLFFGASHVPIMRVPDKELEHLELIWRMFEMEFRSQDHLQLESLQSILKRFIIMCTRIYKRQSQMDQLSDTQVDIVREYNYLVEQHFRSIHTVAEYAEMLNKTPKTLSNLFAKISERTPSQFIKQRRMLEAKRLLRYTDKAIKEIAYEIGFDDIQRFSRFFKSQEGQSPKSFREASIVQSYN